MEGQLPRVLIVRLCTKDNVAKERYTYWLKYIQRRARVPAVPKAFINENGFGSQVPGLLGGIGLITHMFEEFCLSRRCHFGFGRNAFRL